MFFEHAICKLENFLMSYNILNEEEFENGV